LAKEKLRDDRLSQSKIAGASGSSDQSHFTKVFTRVVGISPGAWRRTVMNNERWYALFRVMPVLKAIHANWLRRGHNDWLGAPSSV
jgi:hypothetical protein